MGRAGIRGHRIACPTTTHCIALAGNVGESDNSYDWTPKTGWSNDSDQPPYDEPPFIVAFSSNALQSASSTRCYAADGDGHIWTTTNAGKTWSKTTTQPAGVNVDLVTCVGRDTLSRHRRVGLRRLPSASRTTNGGTTWMAASTPAVDPIQALLCNVAAKCIITDTHECVPVERRRCDMDRHDVTDRERGQPTMRCRSDFCVVVGPVTLRTP